MEQSSTDASRVVEEWITFEMSGEHYALEVNCVKEIKMVSELSPIPGSPASVVGILKLRGEAVTVVDGAMMLNLNGQSDSEKDCIIILEFKDCLMGLLVNEVKEIVKFAKQDIEVNSNRHSKSMGEQHSDIILGTYQFGDRLVIPIQLDSASMIGEQMED